MNHFNPAASYPPHMLPDTLGALPHLATTPIDEHGSQSGSDDGTTYSAYTTVQGTDLDVDDNAHSLTSQSLNADGTPKRPMNAFMIFARKRRPQVSAENQSMRTGEISKILSKEWNSMPSAEKQFYLDQAKILKDNFNNKYPDYVYRRRPNNTRKKRRCDTTSHSADNAASDQGDEVSPLGDCEPSPVEGEPFYGSNASQPRAPMDPTAPFAPNGTYESQYVFPPHDDSFSMPDHRSPFHLNHPRHATQDPLAPRSPLNASHLSQYSFLSGQSDPRSNPYASTHQGHPNAAWDSGPSGRPPPLPSSSQWTGNNSLERPLSSLDHRSTKFHSQHQHTSYSPTNAQSPNWPGSSPSQPQLFWISWFTIINLKWARAWRFRIIKFVMPWIFYQRTSARKSEFDERSIPSAFVVALPWSWHQFLASSSVDSSACRVTDVSDVTFAF
ncbi:hypothetical protein ONZ45_g7933 [Pleurotus djamor]|nr:hypothetical protein ONZ45_g7933 [Pleurotus djamor]